MQQLVLLKPGSLALRDVDPPHAGPGEMVVRIRAALTCGTDMKTFRRGHPKWPMPMPFGHEFSGDVCEVGPGVTRFHQGQAVLVAPTGPCGACPHCHRGLGNLCDYTMSTMMLGAFAEYIRVPAHIVTQNVYPKPENLSYPEGAVLEPLACVVYGGQHLPLDARDTVVILGAGPIGLLQLMLTRLRGAGTVVVVGRRRLRLATARHLGADVVLDEVVEDVFDRIHHLTSGRGADVVIECTGQPQVWEQAVNLTRRGGQVMLFGGCASGSQVRIPADRLLMDGLSVKGVFHFTPEAVRESYRLLASGALNVSRLISDVLPLSEYARIFETLGQGEVIKLGVIPGQ